METIYSIRLQKVMIFCLIIVMIIAQTFFSLNGSAFFFSLPSVFLVLTFKPKLLGYFACFALGIINDLFCMQILGLSSAVFVLFKYLKTIKISGAYKHYQELFIEYVVYSFTTMFLIFIVLLMLGLIELNWTMLFSLLLLVLGFFIADYIWLKTFRFLNGDSKQ